MELKRYILLFYRQLAGRLDRASARELADASTGEDKAKVNGALERIWEGAGHYGNDYEPDVEAGLERLRHRIGQARADQAPVRPLRPRRRWLSAAAVLLLLSAAWWLLAPDAATPTPTVVSTRSGEKQRVELPDGTVVVLNEDSRLTYPGSFQGQAEREIRLTGEAYFTVTPRPEQPFVIETEKVQVTVLGTSFNLRAYPTEGFSEVEVLEGRVRMVDELGASLELVREERGTFQHGQSLTKTHAAGLNAASWQTGRLQFRNTPVAEVIQTLERHFSIRIDLESEGLRDCTFDSNFEKARLEDILTTLELVFNTKSRQVGQGHYLLLGGTCR